MILGNNLEQDILIKTGKGSLVPPQKTGREQEGKRTPF